ncbi:MAG: hypothetical protein QNK29_00960, partial [Desulfobacterales bacterium]|nr:hypothetical protein [Desulfobacterales bacterium]
MTGNKLATVVISKTAPMPAAMSKIPPANARITDSARNCMIIWPRVPPTARLIPISFMRSETVASIIFIIPIPPTSKEIPAMAPRIILNIRL